jgi:hypothetical protein
MYKPFAATALISILCTVAVFAGAEWFPKWTDRNLFTIIGILYLGSFMALVILSIRDYKLIYVKKHLIANILLIILSTPVTLISEVLLKDYYRAGLNEVIKIIKNIYSH